MKKKMIVLLAAALLALSASSSFAYFSGTNELYMAAYDTVSNNEVVIDLGSLTANGNGAGYYSLASSGTNSFNESLLGGSASAATTNVSFFGRDVGANYFASSAASDTPQNAYNKYNNFNSAIVAINNVAGTGSATSEGASSRSGYVTNMNAQMTGGFASYNDGGAASNGFSNPEMTLSDLIAGTNQNGPMGIFSFASGKATVDGTLQFNIGVTDAAGLETFNVTSANVATTPIPAAAYLLGSGLMGLVGLRRKKNA